MADATITGRFDAAINSSDTATTLGSGPNAGSEVVVGISEDLGNGLTATAAITILGSITNMSDTNSGDGFGMYQSHIGIAGEFGSAKLGAQWSPMFLTAAISDISGRWNSSSLANPNELQNFNSLTYTSPNISGFTFSYQAQLTDSADIVASETINRLETGGKASAYSLTYSSGALTAAYANSQDNYYTNRVYDNGTTNSVANSTLIAVNYDLGVAKLHYAHLVTNVVDGSTDVTSNGYGVTVPVGAFILGAQNSSSDADSTMNSYIVNYSVSKKTMVYYSNTNLDGAVTNQLGITMTF